MRPCVWLQRNPRKTADLAKVTLSLLMAKFAQYNFNLDNGIKVVIISGRCIMSIDMNWTRVPLKLSAMNVLLLSFQVNVRINHCLFSASGFHLSHSDCSFLCAAGNAVPFTLHDDITPIFYQFTVAYWPWSHLYIPWCSPELSFVPCEFLTLLFTLSLGCCCFVCASLHSERTPLFVCSEYHSFSGVFKVHVLFTWLIDIADVLIELQSTPWRLILLS